MRKSADAMGLLGDGTPTAAWLAWVEAHANRIDPSVGTPSVPGDPAPHAWVGYGYASPSSEPRPLW